MSEHNMSEHNMCWNKQGCYTVVQINIITVHKTIKCIEKLDVKKKLYYKN